MTQTVVNWKEKIC